MNADPLFSPGPPHLHLLTADPSETCDFAWALQRKSQARAVVRVVRGSKSRTLDGLFDEMAAALQFPYYFGENWAAVDECLADLEWLPGDAYILFFTNCEQVLDSESTRDLEALFQVLENAVHHWSQPEARSSRPSRVFHAVFQCLKENAGPFLSRIPGRASTLHHLHVG
jgi:hypothetical protein